MPRHDSRGEAFRLVAESGLPIDAQKRIVVVLDESKLSREQQIDVARELIAHFEDGLAAGARLLPASGGLFFIAEDGQDDDPQRARWRSERGWSR